MSYYPEGVFPDVSDLPTWDPVRLHCERDPPKKHICFYCGAVQIILLFWNRYQLIVVQAVNLHLAKFLPGVEKAVHVSSYEFSDSGKGIAGQRQEDLVTC